MRDKDIDAALGNFLSRLTSDDAAERSAARAAWDAIPDPDMMVCNDALHAELTKLWRECGADV